jgi:hypothetical protein
LPRFAFRAESSRETALVAAADLDEERRQLAHHLPEKVRGGDAEENEIAGTHELAALHHDDARVFFLQPFVGEGAEVVPSGDGRCRALHGLEIEPVLDPPDERLRECGSPRGDLVEVDAHARIVARVEVVVRADGVEHADVVRQQIVQFAREQQRIVRLARAKMRDLRRCVHARIGPSGASDVDLAEDVAGGAQQVALDRLLRVTLRLPTGIASAFVLDRQFVGRHIRFIPSVARDSLCNWRCRQRHRGTPGDPSLRSG